MTVPIIKHISIHTTPKAVLQYIMNGDKTDECKFITGLNLSEDVDSAYDELECVFENCTGERFSVPTAEGKKNRIRLHHYIQSFDAGEVTAKQAHDFGVEWAKRVFGENRQIMVCTHLNTKHIHNHFAVATYDLDRNIWRDNKQTLKRCRDISDEIAKERNIKIIENPKRRSTVSYCEWLARQNGTSWKVKLAEDIDRIVLQDNVHSIEDFKRELEKAGYDVEQKKYISAKPKYIKNRKPMMTLKLGDGYGMEEILYRIEHKNREFTIEQINSYTGIQREYAICLREMQINLYRHGRNVYPRKAAYGELCRNSELLTFICENNIHSVSEFETMVNSAAEKVREVDRELARWRYRSDKEYPEKKNIMSEIERKREPLAMEKKHLSGIYRQYLDIMESDYDKMLRQLKERYGDSLDNYGVKYDFMETVRKMAEWAHKVQLKAEREERIEINTVGNRLERS